MTHSRNAENYLQPGAQTGEFLALGARQRAFAARRLTAIDGHLGYRITDRLVIVAELPRELRGIANNA